MVAAARDHAVGIFLYVHAPLEEFQGVLPDVPVIDKAHRFTDLAVLHAGRELFDKALAQVVVDIELGVARDLDHMGRDALEGKHVENVSKAVPDQVVEQNDVVLVAFFR